MPVVRRVAAAVVLGTLASVAVGTLPIVAQEPAPAAKPALTSRKKGEGTRRVPDYFGQIGLTPEQKTNIYGVVDKHMTKVEALEKQIEAEKASMIAECETQLDDTQKKLLTKLRSAAVNPAGAAGAKSAATAKPAN